ncbi:hypothetical protein pb186bvf_008506 [Paramecium bursaria]
MLINKVQESFSKKVQLIDTQTAYRLLNSYRKKTKLETQRSPLTTKNKNREQVHSFRESMGAVNFASARQLPFIQANQLKPSDVSINENNQNQTIQLIKPQPKVVGKRKLFVKPSINTIISEKPIIQLPKALPSKKKSLGITAKSFIVYDCIADEVVLKRKMTKKLEVASLTKIMTLYVTIKVLQELDIDPTRLMIKVTKQCTDVIGTSADLHRNDLISVYDLYYGLMLPSGNDAGFLLSQGIGTLLLYKDREQQYRHYIIDIENLSAEGYYYNPVRRQHDQPSDFFIREMNKYAQLLGMENTYFDSPHGLCNKNNYSCCEDLIRLCLECIKFEHFKTVVGCKEYLAQSSQYKYSWQNTNKLLTKGFIGIKTGITDNAGPCLASAYHNELESYIIVVLKCSSLQSRFDDTQKNHQRKHDCTYLQFYFVVIFCVIIIYLRRKNIR